MRELDPIRRLAPPVEPLAPAEVARIRARARALAPRRRRRLPVAGLLAPVAVAAGVAVVIVLGGGQDREVPAQEPPAAAASVPRLLLDGWNVARVDEWKVDSGEMTFRRGGDELEVGWMPTDMAGDIGRKPDVRRAGRDVKVAGAQAALWHPRPGDQYVAVWRDGATTLTARASAGSVADFAAVVGGLRRVGEGAWRRALPQRAVTPEDQRTAVEKMIGEIPLPPGLALERLGKGVTTRDRYQLVATVAGTIACGWIKAWVDGDEPMRARAVAVLGTARDWPLLHSIDAEGDYPEVLWQYADAVAAGGTIEAGKTLTVEESYQAALCP